MSDLIILWTKAERLRLDTTLQSYSPFEGHDRAMRLHANVFRELKEAIPKGAVLPYPVEYQQLTLSAETQQAIVRVLPSGSAYQKEAITAEHIRQAREFIRQHYGFDASAVPVTIAPVPETETVEGFFISCGIADGAVFLPSVFSSPVELIVHELGHAMHTTIRRQQRPTDYQFWIGHQSLIESEMCAYHAQFSYLLKYGTRVQFYLALGALFTSVSQLLCLKALIAKKSLSKFQTWPPVQAYRNTASWKVLLDMYRGMQPSHIKSEELKSEELKSEELKSEQNRYVAAIGHTRGMGLALALKLIDKPEGLVAFMKEDSVAKPILVKLNKAFPHHKNLGSMDDINEVIHKISARMQA